MKRKLLFAIVALMCSVGMWAQTAPTEGVVPTTGDFYLYNIGSGKYLNKGVAYGTHSDVDGAGAVITISGETDNYLLHFEGIDNGKYFANDAYVDAGSTEERYTTWSFESAGEVSGYTNVYKLKANNGNTYLYWANATGNAWANETWLSTDATGDNAYWIVIPKATRQAYSAASLTNYIDATWRLKDPDFEGMNDGAGSNHQKWDTNDFVIQFSNQSGYSGMFAERWAGEYNTDAGTLVDGNYHLKDFTQSQTLSGLPLGKYRLSATAEAAQQGTSETISGTYLFAGEQKTPVSTRGIYNVDFTATGSNVTIGMKTESTTANWVSFDNVRLAYIDPVVSVVATNFISGIAMAAEQWYKFTPAASDTYSFSVTSNLTYTDDAAHLSSEDGSAISSSMELTAGTTYYFKSSTAQTLSVSATTALPTPTSLVAAGWEEVTSTSDLANNDYYYVLYSVEGVNQMMAEGIVAGYNEDKNTMKYQTAADPISDPSEVWMIEYDETYLYGVRNLNNSTKYMQSRGEWSWYIQFEYETAHTKWTRFNFAYSDGTWTIENTSCKTQNPDTYHSGIFIGPWEAQSFLNGSAVAGNKEGANVGHFRIFRMAKSYYENRQLIITNKGDISSLINGSFDDGTTGWTGFTSNPTSLHRNWRGTGANPFIERNSDGTMTTTIANMPAGTYKVVAAARTYDGGKMKAQVAGGEYGTELTGTGDAAPAEGTMEINTNGVEMPYSSLGGFTSVDTGHNWHWISATGTLSADGDLVINFTATGNNWMAIDDVHLYCTNLDGTSYTYTVDNSHTSAGDKVVTADIILSNPNTIIYSDNSISTAAGVNMNNNRLPKTNNTSQSHIDNLVLYDGYSFTDPNAQFIWAATLYRSIPADTWCTLVVPFWPTTTLTKKYPMALENGVLTFSDVEQSSWKNSQPMLVKSASAITAISGKRASTSSGGCGIEQGNMTSGEGAPMTGTYSAISAVPEGSYVVARVDEADNLYKVNSTVSLAPFRAYFSVDGGAGIKANVIALNFDELPTAIESISGTEFTVKGAQIYDLAGQRLNKMKKGVNIVNGKKILVK